MIKLVKFQALFLVMASAVSIQSVAGQTNPQYHQQRRQQPIQPVRPWGGPAGRKEAPAEYAAVKLDREVALPNVPTYTGKQVFLSGLQYPNSPQGAGYMLLYNTEHTTSQVKEWWANALNNSPWKIELTSDDSVQAVSKDGSSCIVTVATRASSTPERMKGMRASYTIYFGEKKQK